MKVPRMIAMRGIRIARELACEDTGIA